ncbi:hypothetical protein AU184_14505 [Mycolicibacterium novocastrense]|uniref:hypothetical protein n=1 Tax=Mycolicibacterium novocastrense TaxID=59813 RepID=UPI000746B4C8|nr:hypothetical protein [Mycolicibacterium novocastrense]KUH70013.1 hypothetical protein AU183_10820 [Mycolicibacterium novocastrense]KUH78186.1 hypothetical protein AU072_09585 [Mycolicibacterium novocastrense]KUH79521.1 hypothetical protein AU184_14505 [Mycolicibacterium novocastrense]
MTDDRGWWARHGWLLPLSLGLTAFGVAIAALIVDIPVMRDLHWWSNTLQLVGAIVAIIGFSSAYSRAANDRTLREQFALWAKQFRAWLRATWNRLRGKGVNHVVHASPLEAMLIGETAHIKLTSTLTLDPDAQLRQQVEQVVEFVNRIADQVSALRDEVQRLDHRIDTAATDAVKAAAQALANAEDRIAQLRAAAAPAGCRNPVRSHGDNVMTDMKVAVLALYAVAFLLQMAGAVGVIQDVLSSRRNMRAFNKGLDEADQLAQQHAARVDQHRGIGSRRRAWQSGR